MIELQNIDCNCNDCVFMQRDLSKHANSVELHKKWQTDHFENSRERITDKAIERAYKDEPDKAKHLFNEADKMRFIFNKSTAMINYGFCDHFKKDVSFIPNTCQLETQNCFKHRKLNVTPS